MTSELMRDFAVGGTALGILSAMYFYPYALIQLPVGLLVDRFGPRKLLSFAALVCAVASWWFAASTNLLGASLSRALIGISVGFAFVGTLSIASHFFPRRYFAMLSGLLMAVGMAGAIAGQVPLRSAVEAYGWRNSFQVLSLMALALSIALYVVVPRRTVAATRVEQRSSDIFSGLRQVCANTQSWWCAGAGFGMTSVMLSFAGLWAVPWMTMTRALDDRSAASIASMMFLGWALGSPLLGWLSDHLGRRKLPLQAGALLALLTLLGILYWPQVNERGLRLLFFLNGFGAGAMVLCFATCREWNRMANSGAASGLINMCVVGAGAVMQPLIGALLDSGWQGSLAKGVRVYSADNFTVALSALVVTGLLAVFCVSRIKETSCQQQVVH